MQGTWTWTVTRETFFVERNREQGAGAEVEKPRGKSRGIFSTECTYLPEFYSLIAGGFYQLRIKLFTMRDGCLPLAGVVQNS